MRISIFLFIPITLFTALAVRSQGVSAGAIDKSKPTIYLESIDKRANLGDLPRGYTWLRLHNNSKWGIRLEMSGGSDKKLGDVTLYYDVVDRKENVIRRVACHVCSTNILRPGRSLVFGVPENDLGDDLSIRINFSFEWENDIRVASGMEPQHYVFLE